MAIQKAAVIGAGLMGGGIAAHIANAGHDVVLLDIVPDGARDRNALAEGAVARMLKTDPAPFMEKSDAKRITTGNIEDHLHLLSDADWIVEAVIETVDAKQAVYRKIDSVRKEGAIVSSNTSTIPSAVLLGGMPEAFARDFLITHFFNPPRYMRLLEVVAGPQTRAEAVAEVCDFADRKLGKGVVPCNDTPGFIANRIGTYWLIAAVRAAIESGVTVEEADAVLGRPIGVPKTGIFGLIDLVGLDLMPLVGRSLRDALPESDPFHAVYDEPAFIGEMIESGYIGRKGKGGFYRLKPGSEKKGEGGARPRHRRLRACPAPAARKHRAGGPLAPGAVRASGQDRRLRLAGYVGHARLHRRAGARDRRRCRSGRSRHAPRLRLEARAVRDDRCGRRRLVRREARRRGQGGTAAAAGGGGRRRLLSGRGRPRHASRWQRHVRAACTRPDGMLLLSDIKRTAKPLARNGSASLWDIGDGVACLEFHSKMNALDTEIMALVGQSVEIVDGGMKALVIHNEGSNFSVGMNLGLALFVVNVGAWSMIEETAKQGQDAFRSLKFAPFPVVGAPSGMALGGGCEVLLHCDAVQAHAESYMGLVEVGVGLVPGWGGCKELMVRALTAGRPGFGGAMPAISKVFETIGLAKVSRSAKQARGLGFLREGDGISANRDRLLADAKAKALALAEGYAPPEPATVKLPGKTGRVALKMAVRGLAKTRKATPHDLVVIEHLGNVLTGGETDTTREVSEDRLSELEREALLALIRMPATIARMEHMLETGKPLRN